MLKNFKKIYSIDEIDIRISQIANDITKRFENQNQLLFLGVLNGSFRFIADLIRNVDLDCEIEFIKVRSYAGNESTGRVEVLQDFHFKIKNKNIIIIEDIIDTGRTSQFIYTNLKMLGAKSVKVATLLFKKNKAELNFEIDYIGFEISDDFVVGYGLDFDGKYRDLNGIYKFNK